MYSAAAHPLSPDFPRPTIRGLLGFPALLIFLSLQGLLTACSNQEDPGTGPAAAPSQAEITAGVSILPQKHFVEQIGGDRTAVRVMVLPGESPATYSPTQQQMAQLSRADIYFSIGVPFEKTFLPKIEAQLPDLSIINTAEDIPKKGKDPHIWMNPRLVVRQVKTIRDALIQADPEGESVYRENSADYIQELQDVNRELHQILDPLKGSEMLVYHPAFGYFADEYGLEQKALETEGKDPTPKQLARFIDLAKEKDIQVLFVQAQFPRRAAETAAKAIGGTVVPLDPLAENYLENLRETARIIRDQLGKTP